MPNNRPDLKPHPYGNLTQGSVITCAYAERYANCEVHGLVITARCDIAQNKYPVLNYLPIVTLKDWLERDGQDLLIEDARNDLAGQIRNILRQAGLSTSLLGCVELEAIAKAHFPIEEGTKSQRKAAASFSKLASDTKHLEELVSKESPQSMTLWLQKERPKKIEDLIRRLFRHQVNGHYFLERISIESDSPEGYVVLLREVASISRDVSDKIGSGLEKERYEELCKASDRNDFGLSIPWDSIAMPIVEIGSPTIEHVLQTFSNLFSRIGITDPDENEIREMVQSYGGFDFGEQQ